MSSNELAATFSKITKKNWEGGEIISTEKPASKQEIPKPKKLVLPNANKVEPPKPIVSSYKPNNNPAEPTTPKFICEKPNKINVEPPKPIVPNNKPTKNHVEPPKPIVPNNKPTKNQSQEEEEEDIPTIPIAPQNFDLEKAKTLFPKIDKLALKIVRSDQMTSINQLIDQILNQLHQFSNFNEWIIYTYRLFYAWMCLNSLKFPQFESALKTSPEYEIFAASKEPDGTAAIYSLLCRCLKIPCETIKGLSFNPQYPSSSRFINSTWNLVRPNASSAFLIDCQNGKNKLYNVESNKSELEAIDHFWFFTDPNVFLRFNFPKQSENQLVDEPLDIQILKTRTAIWPEYFMHELHLNKTDNELIDMAKKSEYSIMTKFACSTENQLLFKIILKDCESNEVMKYQSYCAINNEYNNCTFVIRPTKPGRYFVILQLKQISCNKDDVRTESNLAYSTFCVYTLNCSVNNPPRSTFPLSKRDSYGLTTYFKCFPVTMEIQDPVIRTNEKNYKLCVNVDDSETQLLVKFNSNKETDLKLSVDPIKLENDDVDINIKFPEIGEYSLEISALHSDVAKKYYKLIWQYMMIYEE